MYDLTMHERLIDPVTGEHLFPSLEREENIRRERVTFILPGGLYKGPQATFASEVLQAQAQMLIEDFYIVRFLRDFIESLPFVSTVNVQSIIGNTSYTGVYREPSGHLVFNIYWGLPRRRRRKSILLEVMEQIDPKSKRYSTLLQREEEHQKLFEYFGIDIKRVQPLIHEFFHCLVYYSEFIVAELERFDVLKDDLKEFDLEEEELKSHLNKKKRWSKVKAQKFFLSEKKRIEREKEQVLMNIKDATKFHDEIIQQITEGHLKFFYNIIDLLDVMKDWWHDVLAFFDVLRPSVRSNHPFSGYGLYLLKIYQYMKEGYVLDKSQLNFTEGKRIEQVFGARPLLYLTHEDTVEMLTYHYYKLFLKRFMPERSLTDFYGYSIPSGKQKTEGFLLISDLVDDIIDFIIGQDRKLFLEEQKKWTKESPSLSDRLKKKRSPGVQKKKR